jgi:hypothetical protein
MVAMVGANRWQVVSVAVLVESVAGLGYIFSLYSEELKTQFQLTQPKLDLLGTLSNIGGNIGIHIGLLQDQVGPAPVVLLAGFIGVSGWLPMHFPAGPRADGDGCGGCADGREGFPFAPGARTGPSEVVRRPVWLDRHPDVYRTLPPTRRALHPFHLDRRGGLRRGRCPGIDSLAMREGVWRSSAPWID